MSEESSNTASALHDRIPPDSSSHNGNGHAKPKRPKPKLAATPKQKANKALATDRITIEGQLSIIRAYAIASAGGTKPATNEDVAKLVKMQASTVAMTNNFFTSLGFLQKAEAGFVPSAEVISFDRAFQWGNDDTAPLKLAPIVRKAWFMEALLPRLRFSGSIEEREALEILATESSAGPHHRKQLLMLLDYGAVVGLIQRENGMMSIKQGGPSSDSSPADQPPQAATDLGSVSSPVATSPLAAALFPPSANGGAVQFNISVQVNMTELANWQPDRIASFFAGIAQVLAARGKEKEGT